jgi:hypothetical protein
MVEHQAIDRTEAASQLESIEQFVSASDGNFDAVRRDHFYASAQRQPLGAMADKFEKAFGPKSSAKNHSGDAGHNRDDG